MSSAGSGSFDYAAALSDVFAAPSASAKLDLLRALQEYLLHREPSALRDSVQDLCSPALQLDPSDEVCVGSLRAAEARARLVRRRH